MSTEPAAYVTSDGFEVESSSASPAELKANFEAEEKEAKAKAETDERSKAASTLGKAGGEAAAKAKAEKQRAAEDFDAKPDKEGEPEPEKVEAKPEEKHGKPRDDARARVEQATRKLAEERRAREAADRERAELKARLERLEAERQAPAKDPAKPTAEAKPNGKPKVDDFATYEEYTEALFEYKADQKIAKLNEEAAARAEQERMGSEVRKRADTFIDRMGKALEEDAETVEKAFPLTSTLKPTFTIHPSVPLTPLNTLADEVFESERPHRLMAYLVDHPEELERIKASPDPYSVVRHVGRIEAKLEAADPTPSKREPKPVSQAKPPIRPVSGSAQVSEGEMPEDLDSYIKVRNAEEARKRRGRD